MTGQNNLVQQNQTSDNSLFDELLDDLDLLQKDLLHAEGLETAAEQDIKGYDSEEQDSDSLEIPILTQSLNREIDSEHESRKIFDEAQHHLFEEPGAQAAMNEEQVNAIVTKLMGRLKPKVEQLLREKIRAKVIERFNQQT